MINQKETMKITPLTPLELNKHHFGDTEWRMDFGDIHHLFHINRLEDVVERIQFPLPPHRKTVYDFIILKQGTTQRSKGLQEYVFGTNTLFFLPAYQISSHQYMSADAKGFFCHFDIDIFSRLFTQQAFQEEFSFWQFTAEPIIPINDTVLRTINPIFERLEKIYKSSQPFNNQLVASYLLAFFNEVKLVEKPKEDSPQNAALRITEKYKTLLSQHIYQVNKVTEYASMLSVTPDHLNKCIKATIGKTSQDLLGDMMILEAKVMLKQTDLSVSEIAFRFSETNPSDFSRFFKSKIGMSPREFRLQ